MTVPGDQIKDAIRREVLAVLVVLARGRANAMKGERLAEVVLERLVAGGREVHLKPKTLQRRCQEAVAAIVAAGEQEIASASTTPTGYYIPETKEEIEDGARSLRSYLISIATRLRAYDARTADSILELLGQERLVLPKTAPAEEPAPAARPPVHAHQGPPVQLGLLTTRAA